MQSLYRPFASCCLHRRHTAVFDYWLWLVCSRAITCWTRCWTDRNRRLCSCRQLVVCVRRQHALCHSDFLSNADGVSNRLHSCVQFPKKIACCLPKKANSFIHNMHKANSSFVCYFLFCHACMASRLGPKKNSVFSPVSVFETRTESIDFFGLKPKLS